VTVAASAPRVRMVFEGSVNWEPGRARKCELRFRHQVPETESSRSRHFLRYDRLMAELGLLPRSQGYAC
jgi:hypothetical protein